MKGRYVCAMLIGLTLLGANAKALAASAEQTYQSDFTGWRDEKTNAGFHAFLEKRGSSVVVSVPADQEFGKVMSPSKSLTFEISSTLELALIVDSVSEGATVAVEVMLASAPFQSAKVLTGINRPGTYKVNLAEATGWTGSKSFWVGLWIEGADKQAVISSLRIGAGGNKTAVDPGTKEGLPAAITPNAGNPTGRAVNYKYFENWASGLNGWRDDSAEKGMNSLANVKQGGRVSLKLKPGVTYGKFMSPKKPLIIDFSEYPFLEVEIEREFEQGKAKVVLVQATNLKNVHVVIPSFSRPGVYMANIPEMVGWREKEAFFIEVWLEGEKAQLTLSSVGFANKLSTLQGILIPVQSIPATAMAPSREADILKMAVIADQTYRGQMMGGDSKNQDWSVMSRYGIYDQGVVGFSDITQKLYLLTSINPSESISIVAALGYDVVNAVNGITWENTFGRATNAKLDFTLLRYHDLYIGNIAQMGSVYNPLFTDLTFKRASDFRGFLWKPSLDDFQFKFVGTRMATSGGDYKDNVFLLGARATRNIALPAGNVQVGLSALNLSRSNGDFENSLFQGTVDPEEYAQFTPSLYLRVRNQTTHTIYLNDVLNNQITVTGSAVQVQASLKPTLGSHYTIADQQNAFFDAPNGARGMNQNGYVVYKVPLRVGEQLLEPSTISNIIGHFEMKSVTNTAISGLVEWAISSNATDWLPIATFTSFPDISNYNLFNQNVNVNAVTLSVFKQGDFESTQSAVARSIFGIDFTGQLFGVDFTTEYAMSLAHQLDYLGERSIEQSKAFYINLSRGIGGAIFKASYFNIDPNYSTALGEYNTVDDNDNQALLPDRHPDKAGVVFGDFYNLGIPDNEYVIGLYVPRDYLWTLMDDWNLNGILDERENDQQPDYPYRRDQRGMTFTTHLPKDVLDGVLARNFDVQVRAKFVEQLSQPRFNQIFDTNIRYQKTDVEDWVFEVDLYFARVKDQLADQYAMFDWKDNPIALSVTYPDNFLTMPSLLISYEPPSGFKGLFLNRYRANHFMDMGASTQNRYGNETVLDLRYKHYLVGSFSVMPVYIGRLGLELANFAAPMYNTYLIPKTFAPGEKWEMPFYQSLFLKTSWTIANDYQCAVDIGRDIYQPSVSAGVEEICDRLAIGVERNISGAFVRVKYQITKDYFPLDIAKNWEQAALWAQVTVAF